MTAATALAAAEAAGMQLWQLDDGAVRMGAAAPPSAEVLAGLRQHREAVAVLLAERAAREAFYLQAVVDCMAALAVPDPDLDRERAEMAAAYAADLGLPSSARTEPL